MSAGRGLCVFVAGVVVVGIFLQPTASAGNADVGTPASSALSAAGIQATEQGTPIAPALARGTAEPEVLVFNHGFDFPIHFDHVFDFGELPLAGEYSDATLDGIRLQATGLRHWVHVDGSPMGGRIARQPDSAEQWTIDLPAGSHAFEFGLWESTQPGVGAATCYNFDFCTDTLYRVRVFSGGDLIRDFDFSPYDDELNTVALWSSTPISRIELSGVTNNVDDEFLGLLRAGSTPLPEGLAFMASQQNSDLGLHAAVSDGRALLSDSGGFQFWRRGVDDGWLFAGRIDIASPIERLALSPDHAVVATSTSAGKLLHVYDTQGSDPTAWPLTKLTYTGTARGIEIEDDLVALGVDGEVLIYRRHPLSGWAFEYPLLPDPPIAGASQFGRNLGMDDGLLVVNAGGGLFHIYERGAGAEFVEVFRQELSFTTVGLLDISDAVVAVQTFEGGVRVFEPHVSGGWSLTQLLPGGLPTELGLGIADGLRMDGNTIITLQSFDIAPNPDFRRIVGIWLRSADGQFARSARFVEPHRLAIGATQLGSAGRAFAVDGNDVVLGYPFTPWCDYVLSSRSFFGERRTPGYGNGCEERSGSAYFVEVSELGDIVFKSRFEP